MPAPTFVSSQVTAFNSASTSKTMDVAVQSGDLIVVGALSADHHTTLGVSAPGTTFTLRQSVSNTDYCDALVWTATAASTTTLTITVTNTGETSWDWGFNTIVWRNHNGVGSSAKANVSSGAPSLGLTTTGANSAICVFNADWSAADGASRTWRTAGSVATETVYGRVSAAYTWYGAYHADAGSAGSKTVGLSAPSGQKYSIVAVEVLASPVITVTPTPISSTTSVGSPTVVGGTLTVGPAPIASTARIGQPTVFEWWVPAWPQMLGAPEWAALVEGEGRLLSARAELIDRDGRYVADLPFRSASIDFRGEMSEQWAGKVNFADPAMAPLRPTDTLDPRSLLRARFWWRIRHDDRRWLEVPVGTFIIGDPEIADSSDGSYGITVEMRDVLEEVRRNDYGDKLVTVSGLTVDVALKRLFAAIAPWATVATQTTTVTLPSTYQLGVDQADPAKDWKAIADLAGWVVRTDRMGTIVCGPPADRAGIIADWQEGPDCPVTDMGRKISNLGLYNRVLVRSTSQDAAGVYAIVEDADPASPTWVGRFGPFTKVIETDTATTEDGCKTIAQMHLGRYLRPTEAVTVTLPQRGDLDYRDQVVLSRQKSAVGGIYRVSGWSLELGPPDAPPKPMAVTLMTRSLE